MREPESADLAAAIPVGARLATSALSIVEVTRAVRLAGPAEDVEPPLAEILDGCTIIDPDRELLQTAANLSPRRLRSSDAIHLATALSILPDAILVYDFRLGQAALDAGLRVMSPGAER
jgi:hypothetical protein